MQIAGTPGDMAGARDLLPCLSVSTREGGARRLVRPWSALGRPRGSRDVIFGGPFRRIAEAQVARASAFSSIARWGIVVDSPATNILSGSPSLWHRANLTCRLARIFLRWRYHMRGSDARFTIELPGEYQQSTAKAELKWDPRVRLEPFEVRYTNARISLSGKTVVIEHQFPEARTSDQVQNWAITSTTQFAQLMSMWVGARIEASNISWTLEDPSSGVSVETRLEARGELPQAQPGSESLERILAYLSWMGVSYYLPFALMAYHSALGSPDPTEQMTHLYRTLEVLEHSFGGEQKFVEFLEGRGITRRCYKRVKKLINEGGYFIRHSPRAGTRITPIPRSQADECWITTRDVLQSCLEHEHQQRVGDSSPPGS